MYAIRSYYGGVVQNEVVGGVVQHPVQPLQGVPERRRQPLELPVVEKAEVVAVFDRDDPHLEGEAGGEGGEDDEVPFVEDDPLPGRTLLGEDVAEEAALLLLVVVAADGELRRRYRRSDRKGDDL